MNSVFELIAASVVGGLAVWSFDKLLLWWRKPILKLELRKDIGCYVTASRGNPPTHQARFLRLKVSNTGKTTIKSCAGYLVSIRESGTGSQKATRHEVVELLWAHSGTVLRDIPAGAFFHLDVLSLELIPNNHFINGNFPNSLWGQIKNPATYYIEIHFVGENIEPLTKSISFSFDPKATDLNITYDKD